MRLASASGAGLPSDWVDEVLGSNESDAPGKAPLPSVGIRWAQSLEDVDSADSRGPEGAFEDARGGSGGG